MSGTVQFIFSTNKLKEEKVETVIAAEEFHVSEYHEAVSLQGSTFSSSSSNHWNTGLKKILGLKIRNLFRFMLLHFWTHLSSNKKEFWTKRKSERILHHSFRISLSLKNDGILMRLWKLHRRHSRLPSACFMYEGWRIRSGLQPGDPDLRGRVTITWQVEFFKNCQEY